MPLDWLNTPLDADIGDLIARKKRAKTIELLRSQLQGRMVPPVQMRLQLADLLVQAGREAEAIPVLIGLADEFSGDGFVAKAIAILKRVDKVQPGRGDVESRLASLVKQQQRLDAAPKPRSRRAPEFGIEEIPEDEAAAPPAAQEEPAPEPEPAAAVDAEPAVIPAAADVVEPPPIPRAETAPATPADTATTQRVRGVFRRFLASLPGTPQSPATDGELAAAGEAPSSDETVPDVPDTGTAAAPAENEEEGVTVMGADAIELDEPETTEVETTSVESAEDAAPQPEVAAEATDSGDDAAEDDTVPDAPVT